MNNSDSDSHSELNTKKNHHDFDVQAFAVEFCARRHKTNNKLSTRFFQLGFEAFLLLALLLWLPLLLLLFLFFIVVVGFYMCGFFKNTNGEKKKHQQTIFVGSHQQQ